MCPLWFAPGRAVCLVALLNFSVWIPCYVKRALKLRHSIVGVGTGTTKCAVYPEGEADKTNIRRWSFGRKQQRCDRVKRHVRVYHRRLHGSVDAHLEGRENWAKRTLRENSQSTPPLSFPSQHEMREQVVGWRENWEIRLLKRCKNETQEIEWGFSSSAFLMKRVKETEERKQSDGRRKQNKNPGVRAKGAAIQWAGRIYSPRLEAKTDWCFDLGWRGKINGTRISCNSEEELEKTSSARALLIFSDMNMIGFL